MVRFVKAQVRPDPAALREAAGTPSAYFRTDFSPQVAKTIKLVLDKRHVQITHLTSARIEINVGQYYLSFPLIPHTDPLV